MTRDELLEAYAAGRRVFRYANLDGVNLSGVNLRGVDLERAMLRYAVLDGASLRHASLTGASLIGANVTGAIITRANFDGAIGLPQVLPHTPEASVGSLQLRAAIQRLAAEYTERWDREGGEYNDGRRDAYNDVLELVEKELASAREDMRIMKAREPTQDESDYQRWLANVNDYVSRLIGAERGLCRCCGRAHAIQHDDDCPVPHLIRLVTP